MAALVPFTLKDAPALIEAVFPAQKMSTEAQKERKAVSGQTLTTLGSYWKGRKPLILVRAIILGSLLPQTGDTEKDLEIFEKLMAIDDESLVRRAFAKNELKPKAIAQLIELDEPWGLFEATIRVSGLSDQEVKEWKFPLDVDSAGVSINWRRGVDESDKLKIFSLALDMIPSYEDKVDRCKRPEELDQVWLYESIWADVNEHLAHLGVQVNSHQDLITQLGTLRYGAPPKVADTFCGGGTIPFEAARLGCDVYASDLNPVACMLAWGALNIVGANPQRRQEIERAQQKIVNQVDKEISDLGIEHDDRGNRAKTYLYCLETRCPETGWMVPMSPSWVISKSQKTVAKLVPNHKNNSFDIDVLTGVSAKEMREAESGTVQDGALAFELDGEFHRTPIKTLRGDFRDGIGKTNNRLRSWGLHEYKPAFSDVFRERLYAIQWITKETLKSTRRVTFFSSVTQSDLKREQEVEAIVESNITQWQSTGVLPKMEIEEGDETTRLHRERGWSHWHHLFNARQILMNAKFAEKLKQSEDTICLLPNILDNNCKLCQWLPSQGGGLGGPKHLFVNQAFNTFWNYPVRCAGEYGSLVFSARQNRFTETASGAIIENKEASRIKVDGDIFITDPPYADAINYHEVTEFFIAWLRDSILPSFEDWTWDSRRALAIKGSGDDFRKGMVDAYSAMTRHMSDNGMQCVMFTHQDTGVWSDMVGIFWAAGLRVVGAWYIATETTSELKKGGYVQGTVILMLRKRPAGENPGFKQRILPAVRNEVKAQIQQMLHLNDEVEQKLGEPVFNDSDLQMAGYAAALKVLTAFTHIGGEDVTSFALRPRRRGEVTVVDEIVQQAAEAANSLLVPEGLAADTWQRINGMQRFYLRMMGMETSGASKLDNYQNFAKAFRVEDYTKVMASMTANKARLKQVQEFASRDLADSTELGASWLGHLIIGLQQLLADTEHPVVIRQLQAELPNFMEVRPLLIDMLQFLENKAPKPEVRDAAEVLGSRLKNLRALGQ